jgi:alpha-galactosidase
MLREFDPQMRSRLWHLRAGGPAAGQVALTRWAASEYLLLADGRRVELFTLQQQGTDRVTGLHGPGRCLRMSGVSATGIEKNLEIQLFERYPGIAFYRVSYRNRSAGAIALRAWSSADLHLLGDAGARAGTAGPHFWSYCGSTHADRRDWVQPVGPGFAQDNFMGMTASDYGGGTPVVDLWRRDCGLAVGHLELTPRLLSLPVSYHDRGANLAVRAPLEVGAAPVPLLGLRELPVGLTQPLALCQKVLDGSVPRPRSRSPTGCDFRCALVP